MRSRFSFIRHPSAFILPLLLAVFAALAGAYSLATPVFEGPDEIWHFAFASHLADGGGLPVLDADNPNLLLRNAAHPPLYYLPVAGLIAPLDRQDFPRQFRFNLASPHITPGSSSDRPNLLIHTAHEDFPYKQAVLAVHLGRLVSIALGVLTLWGVWAGARRLAPGSEHGLALLATALAGFVPQFVYGSAMLNNDALAAAAGAWLLVALVELMNTLSRRWALAAGVVLGIGLLSKIGMIAMLPLPVVALALVNAEHWLRRRRQPSSVQAPRRLPRQRLVDSVRAGVIVYAAAALVAGWWYVRNWLLYGDPLAWREWQALAGVGRSSLTAAQFASDLLGLFGTFWADFGLRADRAWVWAFAALVVVAVAGLVVRWRRGAWPALHPGGLVLAAVWFGLLLASAVRYAFVITDIHGRLLYPALTGAALALALGLTGFGPRVGRWLAGGAVAGLFVVTAAVPLAVIGPAFARPVVVDGRLPTEATSLAVAYGGQVALVGYHIAEPHLDAGEPVRLVSYWRLAPVAAPVADTHAVIALVRPDGQVIGRTEARLGSSVYPSSVWRAGDLVRLDVSVTVDAAPDGPVVADLWLGVRGDGQDLLPTADGDNASLGRIAISTGARCTAPANGGQTFGGQIRLVGYTLGPGGVSLCWEALRPLETDYTVFVHGLDQAGDTVAFGDGPPRSGLYPTSAWRTGEQVEDYHPVSGPALRLQVGLYRLGDGERLTVDGTNESAVELIP